MESFFLSETTKYLYLLFDVDNFIHNQGQHGTIINTPNGECILNAGGYIFNTEAHPIDPSALYCCHSVPTDKFDFKEYETKRDLYQGVPVKKKKTDHPIEEHSDNSVIENSPGDLESVSKDLNETTENNLENTSSSANLNKEEIATVQIKEKIFIPQLMLERFRRENKYPRNETWKNNYELLSCKAQHFLQRLSIMGEFFKK